ncbi:MAG TPA: adenylate/guanylate cyclase domain-containing protein [Candidatus Limnocylindrales bacterium]
MTAQRDEAQEILEGVHPAFRRGRHFFRAIPGGDRCKMCASPFGSVGGPFMRAIGKGRWPKNPKYCAACFNQLVQQRHGAEVDASLLFADVRGSTALAETMRPSEFRARMDGFFRIASAAVVANDGFVDKFVGDEIIAIFIPALNGAQHASHAIAAARQIVRDAREREGLPVGAGVNSGVAYVGAVGDGTEVEFTAMGDPVNVAARLAGAAGAGEVLVSDAAVDLARLDASPFEHRSLDLKGKSEKVEVVVLPV